MSNRIHVMPTRATGCCFVSYRRSRLREVEKLVRSLHERGIPTWQDIRDLDETHTNSELRSVLNDPSTASAILWITPDVEDSDIIRRVEAPLIMTRAGNEHDPFFVVPVAAGGADYSAAANAIGEDISIETLNEWNIRRIDNDPAKEVDVRGIAKRVLSRRIRAVASQLDAEQAICVGLFVRKRPPTDPKFSLVLDWSDRISNRHASETVWRRHLLPAVSDVVDELERFRDGRTICVSGLPTISAAFALGRGFLAPRGIDVVWRQYSPECGEANWSLKGPRDKFDLKIKSSDKNAGADDLAVLVSVCAPVEHAWAASKEALPQFRALVDIRLPTETRVTLSPEQALDVAWQIVAAVRKARDTFRPKGAVHFFMAVPVGLAFLVGQLSNTLGPIRLYEHEETDTVGRYLAGPFLDR